jgi:hypothetical protein
MVVASPLPLRAWSRSWTAEADFHQLGIQMRGYHDFGVELQDPRGGVKSKGET